MNCRTLRFDDAGHPKKRKVLQRNPTDDSGMVGKEFIQKAVANLKLFGSGETETNVAHARWTRLVSAGLWLVAIVIVVWTGTDARWRDAEGFPRGAIGLPLAIGAALMFVAWAWNRAWRKFSLWFAVGLVGQAVMLQLIDAGTGIHYQHYLPLSELVAQQPWLLAFVLAQTVLVCGALARRFGVLRAWMSRVLRPWQWLALAAVLAISSAALSRELVVYASELAWATALQWLNLGTLVVMVWALPENAVTGLQRRLSNVLTLSDAQETNPALDRFALLAALCVTLFAAFLAFVSYQQHPHIPDEVAYWLHARFLAAGSWTMPAPPVPEAFEVYLIQFRGNEWFAVTPPGWPAMLSLGMRVGLPWLVNPLLAGANVLLAYLLLQEFFVRKMARLVLLLLCVSPWFVFMSMNFMTHTFTMTCALAAAVLVAWAKRRNSPGWAFVAGGFIGAGSLIRPLDGLVVAALLGLWLLDAQGWRMRALLVTAFVAGAMLTGAAVLPYNDGLSGSATTFPLNAYLDAEFGPGKNDLGFGENRGYGWQLQPFPGHSPLGAVVNTLLNAFALNTDLFGWGIGSLFFIALFIVAGNWQRRDLLMLAVIALTVGVFALYWYSGGPDFGARYWYIILVPCVVLTVRGMQVLKTKLDTANGGLKNAAAYISSAAVILVVLSLFSYVPWRALDKYRNYLNMQPDILALAQANSFGNSLVLIRGESFPDYASTLAYNPLDWQAAEPLYAWARDAAMTDALLKAYPDRPVWLVEGPTRTENSFRVIAGPLAAAEMSDRIKDLP